MIGIDTCFLIDLYWQNSPRNKNARDLYSKLAKDNSCQLAIYYNCFNEFLHVITNSRRFENPFTIKEALAVIDFWCDLENVTVLYPSDSSFKRAVTWMSIYSIGRNRINDTQMAACYAPQGVSKIITANPKDFEILECFEVENYK